MEVEDFERVVAREMTVAQRAALLTSILESSTEHSIIAKNLDGTILAWNGGARRIYGYEAAEVVGKASALILHSAADVKSGRVQAILDGVRTSGMWSGELQRVRKDKSEFTAFVTLTLRRDAAGEPIGFTMISHDLTEQQRLMRELRESQEYTRGLVESNIDALMTTDTLGLITDVNKQMCAATGSAQEQLIGTPFKDYFTDPRRAEDGIRRVLREDRVTNYELTIRSKDGKETLVSYNATTFKGSDGKLRGVFAAARDITAQRALEDELQRKNDELEAQNHRVQEANRLKSEFLANMSHELRTPLNGIIGFAELMHDEKVGPVSADHKEYLADILTSSRHLLQLINDVLDLAKVESGKIELRPERIDLAKLIGEMRDILRTLTAEKRIRFTCEVDPLLGIIEADPAKLKQVLYNYLSNALKFTPDEGRVVVRARPDGADRFRLEVEDSGIGIAREEFSRLFVEFQQLDASSAKKYQGTGLGLALTRRIVEAQGGEVGVESTLGKGSTFFANLPRISQVGDVEGRSVARAPTNETGRRRVLVVEDDAKQRAWLVETLGSAGYVTEEAASGAAAISAAKQRHFECVTLDLLLPDMSGWEVLRQIRASEYNRDVPAIVVTVVAEKSAALGFVIHDFLVKPTRPADLALAVERLELPLAGRSILIVDDDPNAAKLVESALQGHGFEVKAVRDAESGLEAVAARAPSVLLLDLLMPGVDGFEFLRRFRRTDAGRRTPVIIWTVKDLTFDERTRLQASAQAVIVKGAGSTDALIAELAIHLRKPSGGPRGA